MDFRANQAAIARAPAPPARRASEAPAGARALPVALIVLLGVGFALRLALTPLGDFRTDAQIFAGWANRLATTPLADFYASGGRVVDHLPGDLWFLWALGHLYRLFSPVIDARQPAFTFLLTLPPALADTGIGAMLFLIARRLAGPRAGLLAAAFFLLNPASIFLTAIWGQWDAVSAFFLLMALWLLVRGDVEWSLLPLTYAALIKPQMALLFPLVALAWGHWRVRASVQLGGGWPAAIGRGLRRLAPPVAASIALFALVDLPFNVGLPLLPTRWTIFDRVQAAWNQFSSVSVNAFNLWSILGHSTGARGVPDARPFLLGPSYQNWGTILLLAAVLLAMARFWRRPSRPVALWAALVITYALFLLPTRIHERYLLPAVALAVLLAALAGRRPVPDLPREPGLRLRPQQPRRFRSRRRLPSAADPRSLRRPARGGRLRRRPLLIPRRSGGRRRPRPHRTHGRGRPGRARDDRRARPGPGPAPRGRGKPRGATQGRSLTVLHAPSGRHRREGLSSGAERRISASGPIRPRDPSLRSG
jgi:hypothetical protein